MSLAPHILQLTCPACDARIDSEEINIKLAVAKCTACQTVFSFADQLPPAHDSLRAMGDLSSRADTGGQAASGTGSSFRATGGLSARADTLGRTTAGTIRPEVPLPSGIRVEQWGHELSLARRWFTPAVLFLLFFCVAWDGFLVFWYSLALTDHNAPWIMLVFPVAHVAVGIGLTYFTLATLLNTTRLRIAGGELTVRHGPIPWRGEVSLPADQIEQIFCSEKAHHGKNDRTSWTYRVNAMLADGRKIELLSGLPEPDQALYIEQTIEDHLRIVDRPVGGEMSRS